MACSPKKHDMKIGSCTNGMASAVKGLTLYCFMSALDSSAICCVDLLSELGLDLILSESFCKCGRTAAIRAEPCAVVILRGSTTTRKASVKQTMASQYGTPAMVWIPSMACITKWLGYHPKAVDVASTTASAGAAAESCRRCCSPKVVALALAAWADAGDKQERAAMGDIRKVPRSIF